MIFTDRTITVRKGESRIDEPIVVYRGDYELEVRFTILNSKFRFMSRTNLIESEKASYGQLAILTPYGGNIFSDIVRCNDGSVTFVLTADMLNQIEEIGLYSFQLRLMDYTKESRVSIPPIEFGIEVREPIASEDHDNSVNNAIVGYSIAKVVDPKEENVGDTFDEDGNYNKTKWETGDRISEGKLNKIEDAIDKINENEVNNTASLSKRIDNNFSVLDATKADKNDYFRVLSVLKSSKNANCNAQPLPYNGKKLCTLGDSITASGAWQPYVVSNLGFSDFVNCGIGGTKVSGDYGSCFSHDNRINSIPEDSDVIIIMGGTNDCGQSVELGDLSYPFNVNTFKGGLAETIRKTQARCPNAIVVVSSLLSGRGLVDEDGNAINMTEPVINSIGLTSEDYAKATQEVAHFMSVDFIDLFGSTGINQFNRKLYISDMVHATVEGNKKIAKVMINGLKNIHPIVY